MGRGSGTGKVGWAAMLVCATHVARAQDRAADPEPPTKRFPSIQNPSPEQPSQAQSPRSSPPRERTTQAPPASGARPQGVDRSRSFSPLPYRGSATEESIAQAPSESRWYGWQTLSTD